VEWKLYEKMEMGVKAIYSNHGGSFRSLMSNYKIVKKFDTNNKTKFKVLPS
jgi:ferredoxin-fold anticodon binding domain-containing protein